MPQLSLPPYLGTWEELVQALLHNPYLGSGRGTYVNTEAQVGPTGREAAVFSPAVSLFVAGIGMKEVASKVSDTKLKTELNQAADQALTTWEDDYCGTPPRPNPRAFVVAAELVAFGSTLQPSTLQNEVFRIAGQIVQKSLTKATTTTTERAVGAGR